MRSYFEFPLNPFDENQANAKNRSDHLPKVFDHERLDLYQLELQFITWVTPLIEEARANAPSKTREVCEQPDRASLSALLNTAEGNGKRQRPVRAKFFDDARGSATECAGCLDALAAKQVCTSARIAPDKALLLRIVSMLCRLVDRFDFSAGQLHETGDGYQVAIQQPQPVNYQN